jgi:hypothetical protein
VVTNPLGQITGVASLADFAGHVPDDCLRLHLQRHAERCRRSRPSIAWTRGWCINDRSQIRTGDLNEVPSTWVGGSPNRLIWGTLEALAPASLICDRRSK